MRALLILDLQNDYGALGAAPIPESEQIIPVINQLMEHFDVLITTQDWHPADHVCFAANHPWRHPGQTIDLNGVEQELSIIHCVQEGFGAELMGGLDTDKINQRFYKGVDRAFDSYSAFFDRNKSRDTGLNEWLKSKGIKELYVVGLRLEKGVRFTVLDALKLGFKVFVVKEGVKSISGDAAVVDEVFAGLEGAGALVVTGIKEV